VDISNKESDLIDSVALIFTDDLIYVGTIRVKVKNWCKCFCSVTFIKYVSQNSCYLKTFDVSVFWHKTVSAGFLLLHGSTKSQTISATLRFSVLNREHFTRFKLRIH
jgi:hypothetical protein